MPLRGARLRRRGAALAFVRKVWLCFLCSFSGEAATLEKNNDFQQIRRIGCVLAVFWGLNWPVMKIGLSEVSPWVFRGCASICGALGLFAISKLAGHSLKAPPEERFGLVVCGLLNLKRHH